MKLPPFTIAVIVALALALVLVLATRSASRVEPAQSLTDKWRVAATDIALARPREEEAPETKLVKTERITMPPPPAPVAEPIIEEAPQPVVKPRRVVNYVKLSKRSGDVCRQHGQRKVFVGKYRWRCRR